ncbi:hypothetical protein CR513_07263, partial [Mucuna pruriens]
MNKGKKTRDSSQPTKETWRWPEEMDYLLLSVMVNEAQKGLRVSNPYGNVVKILRTYGFPKRMRVVHHGSIMPKIMKELEKESKATNYWILSLSRERLFEVRHLNCLGDRFIVNLDNHECSCRKWMLTSIPCCHAISYMKFMNLDPNEYIPTYFRNETYEVVYQHLWHKTCYNDGLSPPIKKMPRNVETWNQGN